MSFKIAEKMDYDRKQTKLDAEGYKPNKAKYAKDFYEFDFNKKYLCPFCLELNEGYKFNSNHGYFRCPNCKNQMMLKTLNNILSMSNTEFAKWVFDYRLNGFWDKIPDFEKWNNNLYILGISREFWEEYKKLRGDSKNDREEWL